jgi:cellulose synthase/poly-beta-1,6-N-acetylglucosamine synthase-like glycosyltransferase
VAGSSRAPRRERARGAAPLSGVTESALHALLVAGAVATVLGAIVLPVNLGAFPRLSREARGEVAGTGLTDLHPQQSTLRPAFLPRVSVVIPARDEAAGIERTVRSHLAQEYPDLQVVVVDDCSRDGTGEIVAAIAREDPRVTLVLGADPPEGWLGKPHALWLGARAADGDLILFADGDVRYHPRALREAVALMEDRSLDLLTFFPRLEARGFWENVLMPYLAVAVFLGLGFLARVRRCPIAMGAGAGNLVRRRTYDAVGGHGALRDSVVDDVRLAGTVKRAGFRVAAFRAEDRVFVRMYQGFRGVWNGFTKNIAWVYSGFGGLLLFGLTVLLFAVSIAPAVVLALAAVGASIPARDVVLAAAVFASSVLLRTTLAAALGGPLWPALTNPIMTAVWAGLMGRSLFQRFIRRRLTWRGREFDARRARF